MPATPGNFKRLLRKGSVAVVVGGIAEVRRRVSEGRWVVRRRCTAARLGPGSRGTGPPDSQGGGAALPHTCGHLPSHPITLRLSFTPYLTKTGWRTPLGFAMVGMLLGSGLCYP